MTASSSTTGNNPVNQRLSVVEMRRAAERRLYSYDNTEPGCRELVSRQFLVGEINALRRAEQALSEQSA